MWWGAHDNKSNDVEVQNFLVVTLSLILSRRAE
jgi:hypothetical protein